MLRNLPIRRKLMLVIFLTSVVVMLLMQGAFFTYEYVTFRRATVQQLSTVGKIIAGNSTAALAFENQDDAAEILSALAAERHVVAAVLYDRDGRFFARYPASLSEAAVPRQLGADGYTFVHSDLEGYQPVLQRGRRLGTLYLRFDAGAILREWILGSLPIALGVMGFILAVAYGLSRALQAQISAPILALTATARAISERHDYSVRARRMGNDEIGLLTDSFNRMLTQIQELNQDLEKRVNERTAQWEMANGELQRSRAQLKSFFESLPGLFLILTPELAIVTASDAYLKATMTRREDIVGRNLFDVFPDNPADPGATGATHLRQSLDRVRQNSVAETMAIQKYDIRRPDGTFEEHYWSPINAPVLGPDRQVEFIIHRVEEVTDFVKQRARPVHVTLGVKARMEQMEAEIFRSTQAVQRMNGQLQAANKELESFSYSVSHDLRAPLRHIDGYAQLLAKHVEKTIDDTGRRYLATIAGSAKRLGVLIDELLVFSRMSRTELRRAPVDPRAIVHEVVQELAPETKDRRIEWVIAALPIIQADPVMLRQVWSNLVGNAVKYSRKREVARIEITHRLDAAGCHEFAIRDNGAGFQMEYANKLFGVFQRLHHPKDFEGTGIGLANVRRIVERHGGRTWAEGQPDVGATFFFTLPEWSESDPAPS